MIFYAILLLYAGYALYPIYIMVMTSFKPNLEIMKDPLSMPKKLYFDGYIDAWTKGKFSSYFLNSALITGSSLCITIVFSLMAAYSFSRFKFKGHALLFLYFLAGIMIPIKLGTANLFRLMQMLHLTDTRTAVILVNIAMSIPFSVFILTGFMKQVPLSLEEAAKIDGCSGPRILWQIIVPLIRPALATCVIMNFLPIWNDFYFPLLFIHREALRTIPLGIAQFFGEFQTDINIIFSGLTIASIPTVLLYTLLSKQFIEGVTDGALKG